MKLLSSTSIKTYQKIAIIFLMAASAVVLFSGCGKKTEDIMATVDSAVVETIAARPTETSVFTSTIRPTYTLVPTYTPLATDTPFPTYTRLPTYTPLATGTARPTHTPYPTSTPYSTYTPLATYTPNATFTPLATQTMYPTYTLVPTQTAYPTYTLIPTQTKAIVVMLVTPTIESSILNSEKEDGFYLVNVDIAPGLWRTQADKTKCYWKISDPKGGIQKNFLGIGGGTIPVTSEDFQIEIRNCGTVKYLGFSDVLNVIPAGSSATPVKVEGELHHRDMYRFTPTTMP